MLSREGMVEFDEAIREKLVERKQELKLTDKALGQMAFPFMAKPGGKVRSMLVDQGVGEKKKPQEIRLADLVNLSQALGLNVMELIRVALKDTDGR